MCSSFAVTVVLMQWYNFSLWWREWEGVGGVVSPIGACFVIEEGV